MRMEYCPEPAARSHLLVPLPSSQSELPQRLSAALIECTQKDRIIGHIARDSTAIEAREKFPDARSAAEQTRKQRRPKRAKAGERCTRLERQRKQTLAQQLAALPRVRHRREEEQQRPPPLLARL